MKNVFVNIVIKIIVLIYLLFVVVWVGISTPLLIVSSIVKVLLCYYNIDNGEVSHNEISDKLATWAADFMVLPYRWIGVAKNYKEFSEYVNLNLNI